MTFTSFSYCLFLPAVYAVFHLLPERFRPAFLLCASYVFYSFFGAPQLLVILAGTTLLSYFFALRMAAAASDQVRWTMFRYGAFSCLALLAAVKLAPVALPAGFRAEHSGLLLAAGVSYFIFQAVAYLADVYLGVQEPEPSLLTHSLALAFFPKLLQGPIERAGSLLPQLKAQYVFDYDRTRRALLLLGFGLFKKIVVADRLGQYSDIVFGNLQSMTCLPVVLGTYAYAFQIYLDFSGYTDMARGTALLFGINLSENFNSPYLASSVADFWRRWHMSFSRWILDYIFKPLQLAWRDHGNAGTAAALIAAFLASGLWHGISPGFVVWGLLHGLYLAASVYYRPWQRRLHAFLGGEKAPMVRAWRIFVTFNLVSLAWIFFRSPSLADAFTAVRAILHPAGSLALARGMDPERFIYTYVTLQYGFAELAILGLSLGVVLLARLARGFPLFEKPAWFRWGIYYALFVMIVFFGVARDNFIYLKF